MTETTIDYEAVFRTLPRPLALLNRDGIVLDVNESYVEVTGRKREQMVGRNIFDLFPQNPDVTGDEGPAQLRDSLESVVASGEPDSVMPIRYDVEDPGRPGAYEERYWAVINTPLRGPDGSVVMIAHYANEVTHIVNQSRNQLADQG